MLRRISIDDILSSALREFPGVEPGNVRNAEGVRKVAVILDQAVNRGIDEIRRFNSLSRPDSQAFAGEFVAAKRLLATMEASARAASLLIAAVEEQFSLPVQPEQKPRNDVIVMRPMTPPVVESPPVPVVTIDADAPRDVPADVLVSRPEPSPPARRHR